MSIAEYKKVKKIIDKAIRQTKDEAIGVDTASSKFSGVIEQLKENLIIELGFDLKEYNKYDKDTIPAN